MQNRLFFRKSSSTCLDETVFLISETIVKYDVCRIKRLNSQFCHKAIALMVRICDSEQREPRNSSWLFSFSWEQRKVNEIATEITRTDSESTAPVMMISAASGFINQSEKYAFDNAGQSLQKYIVLKKGELAYNHGASKQKRYGSCFSLQLDEARVPFVYHCFEVGQNNPDFIAIELNSTKIDVQLRRLVSSGCRMDGLLNISYDDYATVEIPIPQRSEQDKISLVFSNLDRLITLHQREYLLFEVLLC